MDQFVCVRLVKANTMDLTLFQFDYDLTFSVFFLNADKTIYGRYGTRSSRENAEKDITLEGFRAALAGALELHEGYPDNKSTLAGKQPLPTEYRTPLDYPTLRDKFEAMLDYEGKVTESCMHCHQVRTADLAIYRQANKPIPDAVVFPFPQPKTIGLTFDPDTRATVDSVQEGSAADAAGLKIGDEILVLDGQEILSIADVQWVLHKAGESAQLDARVRRGDRVFLLNLSLAKGWRRSDDISWQYTAWEFRRLGTGYLILEDVPDSDPRRSGIDPSSMALNVKAVPGGNLGVARKAGFLRGDLVISYNGSSERMTESQLFAYIVQNVMAGESVQVEILRDGKRMTLELPVK